MKVAGRAQEKTEASGLFGEGKGLMENNEVRFPHYCPAIFASLLKLVFGLVPVLEHVLVLVLVPG